MLVNMGQSSSSAPPKRRRSLRSPFLKRSHKPTLSHAFSVPNDDHRLDQLNVNLATEEELMTLSGITRDVAKAIVKHRQAIGRFRKVEDLALVGGIGAVKMDLIKGEICVKSNSCCSSRAQSVDSLKCCTDVKTMNAKLVDVNRANIFELQCVNGMSQEMAANIVDHRTKKGPFKKIDDLIKVRSINHPKLSNMCHQLTINGDADLPRNLSRTVSATEMGNNNQSSSLFNGHSNSTLSPTKHRKTASAPVKLQSINGTLPSAGSLADIFDLLSAYSYRPIPEEEFRYARNGRDAFRIATWNLHEFTYEKALNMGVSEVICRTILENRWSILCLQDIHEYDALELICNELNAPRLRKVDELKTNSYEWKCVLIHRARLAFIYDAHSGGIGVDLTDAYEDEDATLWCSAEFVVGGQQRLRLINVDFNDFANEPALIEEELNELMADTVTITNILILGDLTRLPAIERKDITPVIPLHTNTACASIKQRYSDNILVGNEAKTALTGTWGIVKTGLTHLAIPNGWSWGGPVSPHCPLWIECYAQPTAAQTNGF